VQNKWINITTNPILRKGFKIMIFMDSKAKYQAIGGSIETAVQLADWP
jgi:hypothetical protein